MRQTRVDLMQCAHEHRQQRPRGLPRAHHQAEVVVLRLVEREILRGPGVDIKRALAAAKCAKKSRSLVDFLAFTFSVNLQCCKQPALF